MRIAFYTLLCALLVVSAEVPFTDIGAAKPLRILPNGCLVAAAEYQADLDLRDRHIWTRLVHVNWKDGPPRAGHAICVFSLKNGQLHAYDTVHGSVPLFITRRDLRSILGALKNFYPNIESGYFLD